MVLTAEAERIGHRSAATAAASIHLCYEGSIVESPLADFCGTPDVVGVAVTAPGQGLVEWFPDDDQPLAELAAAVRRVVGNGWRLAVVVPARRMGEAHFAFRGSPVTLQPWWIDDEAVRFGGPEVP